MIYRIVLCLVCVYPIFAQEVIERTYCLSLEGSPMSKLKELALAGAKRDAVGGIYGERIAAFSKAKDFTLTQDQITSVAMGLIRIEGDPEYYNGTNLGEICVKIRAGAAEGGAEEFKLKTLEKRVCLQEGDTSTIKARTIAKAKLELLLDYDFGLGALPKERVLTLLRETTVLDEDFVEGTSVYCARVIGKVIPVEVSALKALNLPGPVSTEESREPKSKSVFVGSYFENKLLRAELISARLTRNVTSFRITIGLKNKSDQNIYLAIETTSNSHISNSANCLVKLIDEQGNLWKKDDVIGLHFALFDVRHINRLIEIPPNMSHTFSVIFSAKGIEKRSAKTKQFHFSTGFVIHHPSIDNEQKLNRLLISLAEITPSVID